MIQHDEMHLDSAVHETISPHTEIQFSTLLNTMKDIVIFKDGNGHWVNANRFAVKVFQLDSVPGGYIGKTDGEIADYSGVMQGLLEGCGRSDELAWLKKDTVMTHEYLPDSADEMQVYSVTKVPTFFADGTRNQLVIMARDITDQVKIRKTMATRERMFRSLFENYPDPVFMLDTDGVFTDINAATGPYANVVIGKRFKDFLSPTDQALADENFEAALRGQTRTFEISVVSRTQRQRTLRVTNIPIIIRGRVDGVYGIARDITDSLEDQRKIHDLAYLDDLTDLPNRRAFYQQLATNMEHARRKLTPLGVMRLDLDGFKQINDTFSHNVGDEVLARVAQRIKSSLPSGVSIARMVGDEFSIIVPRLKNTDELKEIATGIIASLKHPFHVDGNTFYITVSIGLSTFPESGTRGRELVKSADMALNRAKENGKNQWWFFDPTLNVETYRQFMLKNDLRKAVENGELILYYQPKVNPISHRIVGAEALVRWQHKDWGMVMPDDFIPLAEETGVIHEVGDWVIETACEQIKARSAAGLPMIPISVNVSVRQFMRTNFLKKLMGALDKTGIDPGWLDIELTESVLMNNEGFVSKTLEELHEVGVHVSVDDFGTGYSSLSQLKRYEFDAVKIDKSFVDDIIIDPDAAKLLKAIIQLAHGLGLTVVVEGVETGKQAAFLRRNACDEIQGYLFSRPVPVHMFERMLKAEIIEPVTEENHEDNRRSFYRIDMDYPLIAGMTVQSIHGTEVDVGTTDVLVQNVGPGGLKFLSHIRMPISPNIILKFKLVIYQDIELVGYIVWSNELRRERYEYGVQFLIKESERDHLTQVLNQLQVQLRKHPIIPHCRMLVDSTRNFFRKAKLAQH